MATNLQEHPSTDTAVAPQRDRKTERRMIRLKPSDSLGDRLPAMHLVRSSWFARATGRVLFWLLVVFILASTLLPWQQSSRCEGLVVARNPNDRRQFFLSPVKGVIKSQKAGLQEGTWVEEGEIIMELDTIAAGELQLIQDQLVQIGTQRVLTQQQLDQARERVDFTRDYGRASIEAAEFKVNAAKFKHEKALSDIEAQKPNVKQAELEVKQRESLRTLTVSEVQYEGLLNKLLSEQQKLLNLEQSASQAYEDWQAETKELESKRGVVRDSIAKATQSVDEYSQKLADYEKQYSKLTIDLQELRQLEIKSPSTGWVQSIIGQVGRAVSNGEALFEIIPDTEDLWVELNVRGMDQPLVHVGDKVRIQFEGWPAIQFVGWPSAAKGTFGGVVSAINPADDGGSGNFKIFVGPDPADVSKDDWPSKDYLKQGVRANAWVLMDTVSLGFEIWRQVNGFPATRDLGDKGKKEKEPKAPKLK
ncbi:HlyD family secretion protein [Pirellulaceae bacterium SH449]